MSTRGPNQEFEVSELMPVPTLTVRCARCHERVRVSVSPTEGRPACPSCSRPLPLDRPVNVSEEDFSHTVLHAELPVLVDFYADWCGPCKWLIPILDDLAAEWVGRVLVTKVDTEAAPNIAARYRIGSIPTVILFREGVEAGRSVGVEPEVLSDMLENAA